MNKTFFEFNTLLDDFYCFVLDPSTRYEESKPAVKEACLHKPVTFANSSNRRGPSRKSQPGSYWIFPTSGLRVLPVRAQEMGQILLFHGISRSHWMNEIEYWRDNKMVLAGFERKLQISGILVLLGLIIELGSLFNRVNASSIVIALLFGASLMCLGIFLFVYSLVA